MNQNGGMFSALNEIHTQNGNNWKNIWGNNAILVICDTGEIFLNENMLYLYLFNVAFVAVEIN